MSLYSSCPNREKVDFTISIENDQFLVEQAKRKSVVHSAPSNKSEYYWRGKLDHLSDSTFQVIATELKDLLTHQKGIKKFKQPKDSVWTQTTSSLRTLVQRTESYLAIDKIDKAKQPIQGYTGFAPVHCVKDVKKPSMSIDEKGSIVPSSSIKTSLPTSETDLSHEMIPDYIEKLTKEDANQDQILTALHCPWRFLKAEVHY